MTTVERSEHDPAARLLDQALDYVLAVRARRDHHLSTLRLRLLPYGDEIALEQHRFHGPPGNPQTVHRRVTLYPLVRHRDLYLDLMDRLDARARGDLVVQRYPRRSSEEPADIATRHARQILGQLTERLNYDRLYQDALSDPELKRTQVELEAALTNSREARRVVFDLFQDLDRFSLDDYRPFSDVTGSLQRLVRFLSATGTSQGRALRKADDTTYEVVDNEGKVLHRLTIDREAAASREEVDLLGIDHPLVSQALAKWRRVPPEELGASVAAAVPHVTMLTLWLVDSKGRRGESRTTVHALALTREGVRVPAVERDVEAVLQGDPVPPQLDPTERVELFHRFIEPSLQREVRHRGLVEADGGYASMLIAYVELIPH